MVLVGKYILLLVSNILFKTPVPAFVFTLVKDNIFCLAVNNNPFGDLRSKNICVIRETSFNILPGVSKPPLNKKSGPPVPGEFFRNRGLNVRLIARTPIQSIPSIFHGTKFCAIYLSKYRHYFSILSIYLSGVLPFKSRVDGNGYPFIVGVPLIEY